MTVNPDLIKRCIKNDEKAQNQLFKQCFPMLMGICMRYYKNEADAQAALNKGFYRILTKLKQHDQSKSFEGWAKRVMITTILNELRSEKKFKTSQIPTSFEESEIQLNISIDDINHSIDADAVLELIKRLPENEQRILNLYAIDGYNHKEISNMLSIPEGTSKWLLSSARKKMASSIAKFVRAGISLVLL
jgi:RNA polymerase sigma-70 factor (ECF subfamily)